MSALARHNISGHGVAVALVMIEHCPVHVQRSLYNVGGMMNQIISTGSSVFIRHCTRVFCWIISPAQFVIEIDAGETGVFDFGAVPANGTYDGARLVEWIRWLAVGEALGRLGLFASAVCNESFIPEESFNERDLGITKDIEFLLDVEPTRSVLRALLVEIIDAVRFVGNLSRHAILQMHLTKKNNKLSVSIN